MINIRIAEVMGKRKLTRKAVANATDIRPNTISQLWKGEAKRIEIAQLDRICATLNCQPGDLLEYIPDEKLK